MTRLQTASLLCQAIGLLITGVGLFQTWRAFSPDEERFFGPVGRWIQGARAALSRAVQRVRLLLGHNSARPKVGAKSVEPFDIGVGQSLTVVVYPPLEANPVTSEALSELDRRTRQTADRLTELDIAHAARIDHLDETHRSDTAALRGGVDELGARSERVALDGVRLEVVGLAVLALGLALQALGTPTTPSPTQPDASPTAIFRVFDASVTELAR
jgi:hypothetical protein